MPAVEKMAVSTALKAMSTVSLDSMGVIKRTVTGYCAVPGDQGHLEASIADDPSEATVLEVLSFELQSSRPQAIPESTKTLVSGALTKDVEVLTRSSRFLPKACQPL